MYAVGYEVYHRHQFLVIVFHSFGNKCKLINFNQHNLIYCFVAMCCFVPPFCEATKCRGRVVNAAASYLGGPRFKSQPGDWLC
jgi:hypothetical protein